MKYIILVVLLIPGVVTAQSGYPEYATPYERHILGVPDVSPVYPPVVVIPENIQRQQAYKLEAEAQYYKELATKERRNNFEAIYGIPNSGSNCVMLGNVPICD